MLRADIIIVGARLAGGSLALRLGKSGKSVIILDRAMLPSETLSTHVAWPDATRLYAEMGVLGQILSAGAAVLTTAGDVLGELGPVRRPLRASEGFDFGTSLRRSKLDWILVSEAVATGNVQLLTGVHPTKLHYGASGVRLEAVASGRNLTIEGPLVVGADGRHSWVARQVRPPVLEQLESPRDFIFAYFEAVENPRDSVDMVRESTDWVPIIPCDQEQHIVALSTLHGDVALSGAGLAAQFHARLERNAFLRRVLRRARRVSNVMRAPAAMTWRRRMHGSSWVLVGDAVARFDPMLGVGMTPALLSAKFAAEALTTTREQTDGPALNRALRKAEEQLSGETSQLFESTGEALFKGSPTAEELLEHRLLLTNPQLLHLAIEVDRGQGSRSEYLRELDRCRSAAGQPPSQTGRGSG